MSIRFDDWEGQHLAHHGIDGMHWGQRRYQNPDGTLTTAGRIRYGYYQGGSKKMGRKYNRQVKKLNKLAAKADVNTQKAAAEKYDARAKKAVNVGNIAASTAAVLGLGAYGMNGLAKHFDNKVVDAMRKGTKDRFQAYTDYSDYAHDNRMLANKGDISSNYAKKLNDNAYIDMQNKRSSIDKAERAERIENANKRDIAETVRDVKKYAAYASAATAAGSYGVAAYNKLKSHAAKSRTTAEGHAKAVQKYDKQRAKMEKKFDNTPYADLVKKIIAENKKKQKRS